MERKTNYHRIFRMGENGRLFAVDFARTEFLGTWDEAMELSKKQLFQFKRTPETEHFFGDTEGTYCYFEDGEVVKIVDKQEVTEDLFMLEGQDVLQTNKYDVLAYLRDMTDHKYGEDRDEEDIIETFASFSENGSTALTEIIFDKGEGNDIIVHLDVEDCTKFLFSIDKDKNITAVNIMK